MYVGSWVKLSDDSAARLGAVLGVILIALLAGSVLTTAPVRVIHPGYDQDVHLPVEQIPQPEGYPPMAPDAAEGASFIHNFGDGHDPTRWYKANMTYPSPHPAWLARHIHFLDDRVELELRRMRVHDRMARALQDETLGDAALVEHFDRAHVQAACARTFELLARAPLDDHGVDARERELAREHEPGRPAAGDDDGMLVALARGIG